MIVDANEFFRQVTLRICGDLDIEKALSSTLQFLRQVMPVEGMSLQYFDIGLNSVHGVALVTKTERKKIDLPTPVSKTAIEQFLNKYPIEFGNALLITDPQEDPYLREMMHYRGSTSTSFLILMLYSNSSRTCSLALGSEADQYFDQEHADLLSLLSEPFAIAMSNALKHREVKDLQRLLADDNRYLHGELHRLSGDEIVGANFGLKDVMQKVQQVAARDSPVLLLGETGTGKDVIANMIHYSSSRSDGPFVSVNCGGIPDTLIDSELFGHEKGAFTGALAQKRGRFERAHKGTIFLDEIGELPLPIQTRLLRVLQNKEIERVGGIMTISLDIRIIAATNRDLKEMVNSRQFREDLWFRLNVFPILLPPLRERKVDIPALLQHFLNLKSRELKLPKIPVLAPGAVDPLMAYDWPGNVRELANVVERALITNADGPIDFRNSQSLGENFEELEQNGKSDGLNNVISIHIRQVLAKTKGRINGPGGAAELLEINPNTLRNRMDKLGITYGRK